MTHDAPDYLDELKAALALAPGDYARSQIQAQIDAVVARRVLTDDAMTAACG